MPVKQPTQENSHLTEKILEVTDLTTVFHTKEGAWVAVDHVSLEVHKGEILGLVGESGSGKSVTGFSIFGLIDPPGEVVSGNILFKQQALHNYSEEQLRQIRGNQMAMIFQDPLMTLNPVLTIEQQMAEAITEHYPDTTKKEVHERCLAALEMVGIPAPASRLKNYPHEFSGGMRQRVAIAIAMLNQPDLIIADEPTTALDVTIQGQILFQMQKLCKQNNTALIWITHDLGVIAELADRVAVMYSGKVVETGTVDDILSHPRHPYTQGLILSMPSQASPGERLEQIEGMAPTLMGRPSACGFAPRCKYAQEQCFTQAPSWVAEDAGRGYACFYPLIQERI